jgi:phosphopentomutase
MGYRSDVLYAAGFQSEEQAEAAYVAAKLKYKADDYLMGHIKLEGSRIVGLFDGVKWYDGYDDVDTINNMFRDFFAEELKAHVRYIRIGEEETDIENEDYYDEFEDALLMDCYVVSKIQSPWS